MILNNELGWMWKEAIMAKFNASSQHLPGGSKENNRSSLKISDVPAAIGTGTSRIAVGNCIALGRVLGICVSYFQNKQVLLALHNMNGPL
jgi:hypothetical protein